MTTNGIALRAGVATFTALLAWRIWRVFRTGRSRLDHPAFFFAVVFAALLARHWPEITWPGEINVDESQLLAQGFRYLKHPIPWRDVDGTTSGPLDSMLLSVPMLFGAPFSWATARMVLWSAQCATMFFIYLALRCFGNRAEAQLALMPTVLFYAFEKQDNFTHYSSETLPVLLLCIMVWLLCRAWTAGKFSYAGVFFTGFLAGCVPFAKLQAGPLAALLLAAGAAQIVFLHRNDWLRKTALLLAGTAALPAVLLGIVAANGATRDFWISYIVTPSAYTHEKFGLKVYYLWGLLTAGLDFRTYLISGLAVALLLVIVRTYVHGPKLGVGMLAPLTVAGALAACAIYCIAVTGKGFAHYLLLLVPALAVTFGLTLAGGTRLLLAPEENDPHLFPKPVHWFLAGFALIVSLQLSWVPWFWRAAHTLDLAKAPESKSFIANRILKMSRPGDTMSIWGWMPSYYIETGLMPATRDTIGHFIIEEGPYQKYYQHRYLEDLKRSPPAVFVDAMAPGEFAYHKWTTLPPHESFPELNKFIEDNYALWLSVHNMTDNGPGFPVRIYLLNQRMTELRLVPEETTIPDGH